ISIENINGEKLSSTDYVIVVKPQETKKTFPIRVQSTSNGSPGKYFVDLTWIPENLQPGQAEFILTIYDKDLQPVSGAKYDFAVLQNGKPVYQNSAIAKAGGSFEDVTFFEANKGPLTLQVSKIDRTNESVELPITVTPEFPLGWILVFTILFSGMIVLSKINKKTGYFMSHPF
ncbi:MAG: peptidase, partial [Nitrosopumilaceae archaeon]|nr:peptidase [Nitrosopumilaceae archaeon]